MMSACHVWGFFCCNGFSFSRGQLHPNSILSPSMHLMYTMDEAGNRVYTLKVRQSKYPVLQPVHDHYLETHRWGQNHKVCTPWYYSSLPPLTSVNGLGCKLASLPTTSFRVIALRSKRDTMSCWHSCPPNPSNARCSAIFNWMHAIKGREVTGSDFHAEDGWDTMVGQVKSIVTLRGNWFLYRAIEFRHRNTPSTFFLSPGDHQLWRYHFSVPCRCEECSNHQDLGTRHEFFELFFDNK